MTACWSKFVSLLTGAGACGQFSLSQVIILSLGKPGDQRSSAVVCVEITHFETRLEVLGWAIDTQQLTITMAQQKQAKLAVLLAEWPPSRTVATARQVSQLTGFLMHVSFALRPGKLFVGRLVAAAS